MRGYIFSFLLPSPMSLLVLFIYFLPIAFNVPSYSHIWANVCLQKWTVLQALTLVIPVACIMGGVQAALIAALHIAKEKQLQWSVTLMAVLSAALLAALLAAGVLRHYWDIYVHRTVRGISFLFVGIDAAGDVFSLVSVLFQPKIDALGLVIQ